MNMPFSNTSYNDLKDELNLLNSLYYHSADGSPVSDEEYDTKYQILKKMEHEQGWAASDSPSFKIGIPPHGMKIKHTESMLSMENAFSDEETFFFFSGYTEEQFSLEPKADGLAGTLLYRNGHLITALTRGDGEYGEDITKKVLLIESVPRVIPVNDNDLIEIRGEFVIFTKDFELINQERVSKGLNPYKTARNAVSGTFTSKDDLDIIKNCVQFVAYGTTNWKEKNLIQQMNRVHHLGFTPVVQRLFYNLSEVLEAATAIWIAKETEFPYGIDGLVIKLIEPKHINELGCTAKYPKWAVARKWNNNIVTSTVKDIHCQIGRTGVVTPVATIEPVEIGGVSVERATLHNFKEVARLGIGVGSVVNLIRSGEVIPKILSVIPGDKQIEVKKEPSICPVCQSELMYMKEEDANLYCSNKLCKGILMARVEHFCSRKAMDIENLSEKTIEKLVEKGYIKTLDDVFRLDKDKLMDIDKFAETSTNNLLEAIEKCKRPQLERFIYALGIPDVGEKTSKMLAQFFGSFERFLATDLLELQSLRGIAATTANTILNYIRHPEVIEEIKDILTFVNPIFNSSIASTALLGKTFCITGTMLVERDILAAYLEKHSASVTTSVSKKTTLLLIGAEAGKSKVDSAIKNHVPMLEIANQTLDEIAHSIEREYGIVLRDVPF